MKIFEVMLAREAAPGSFAAKAGVFGKALAGALTKQAFGVDPSQYRDSAGVDPAQINPAVKATVDKVTQQLIQSWPQTVLQIMQNAPTPRGGRGVTSFSKINTTTISTELTRQIDTLVRSLTGNRFNGMTELVQVDTNAASIQNQQMLKNQQAKMTNAFRILTTTDPSAKPDIVAKAWAGVVMAIMTMAQTQIGSGDPEESRLRRAKITKDPGGRIAVDGRVLDSRDANDRNTLIKINALGLMP